MTKMLGELIHLCIKGVPIYGDPCLKCQEIAAERVETALTRCPCPEDQHEYDDGSGDAVCGLCGRWMGRL